MKKFFFSLVGCAIAIVCLSYFWLNKGNQLSITAHPKKPIVVDSSDPLDQFIVPIDDNELWEYSFRTDPSKKEYVQSEDVKAIQNFTKTSVIDVADARMHNIPANNEKYYGGFKAYDIWQNNDGTWFVYVGYSVDIEENVVLPWGKCSTTALVHLNQDGSLKNITATSNDVRPGRTIGKILDKKGDRVLTISGNYSYYLDINYPYPVAVANDLDESFKKLLNGLTKSKGMTDTWMIDQSAIVTQMKRLPVNTAYLTASIYPNGGKRNKHQDGILSGKIPIASYSTKKFIETGFHESEQESKYVYSLDNLELSKIISTKDTSAVIYPEMVGNVSDSGIYSVLTYVEGEMKKNTTYDAVKTFQVFSNKTTGTGNNRKRELKYSYIGDKSTSAPETGLMKTDIKVVEELSTESDIYFFVKNVKSSELRKINMTTYKDTLIETYPKNTDLHYERNEDGFIDFIGSTSELSGVFSKAKTEGSSPYYMVYGKMTFENNRLYIEHVSAEKKNDFIRVSKLNKISPDKYIYIGTSGTKNYPPSKRLNAGKQFGIFGETLIDHDFPILVTGLLETKVDFPPIIKQVSNISINLDDASLQTDKLNTLGWTPLENWLITGSKNGSLSDEESIKVEDRYDVDFSANNNWPKDKRQLELNKKINRNPKTQQVDEAKNISYKSIDWKALGYDGLVGPNLVTYYITDSEQQTSTTSRAVHNVTNQTTEKEEAAIDAQNAHISLKEIASGSVATEKQLKQLAQTAAWDKITLVVDESANASEFSSKVTVDEAQATAIRQATVAKPYPLTFTYKGSTTVTNQIWVFVTDDKTVIDPNGLVIYGKDYRLPWTEAINETSAKTYKNGAIKVYELDDFEHKEMPILPPLADSETLAGLSVKQSEQDALHVATELDGKAQTKFPLTVTYTDDSRIASIVIKAEVYLEKQKVNVLFLDEDGTELETALSLVGNIGGTINLRDSQFNVDTSVTKVLEKEYYLKERPDNETAVPVTKAEQTVRYLFDEIPNLHNYWVNIVIENKQLIVHYKNIDRIKIKLDGTFYKEYQVNNTTAEQQLALDIPVNSFRNVVTADGYVNTIDTKVVEGTYNSSKLPK